MRRRQNFCLRRRTYFAKAADFYTSCKSQARLNNRASAPANGSRRAETGRSTSCDWSAAMGQMATLPTPT